MLVTRQVWVKNNPVEFSMIYYLLTHNHPPLIASFYWTALSDGGHLSVTRMQFFTIIIL